MRSGSRTSFILRLRANICHEHRPAGRVADIGDREHTGRSDKCLIFSLSRSGRHIAMSSAIKQSSSRQTSLMLRPDLSKAMSSAQQASLPQRAMGSLP